MTGEAAAMIVGALIAAAVLQVVSGAIVLRRPREYLDRPSYHQHLTALVVVAAVAATTIPLTALVVLR